MRLMKKLHSHRGESLTETLCAVLIAGLAVSLLAGMVGAASRLTGKANTAAENLYDAVSSAEKQDDADTAGTVRVTVKQGETIVREPDVSVTFYGDGDEALSYKKTGGGS